MSGIVDQAWFWPVLTVTIGLPIALLLLHELHATLVRRGSAYAKPVILLRNWVLPALAAYLLIHQLEVAGADPTSSKVTATVFGFLVMLLVLSGANAALFGKAGAGSWRSRLPGIFVDLGRLILILVGIAVLLSWVWGANIGGLITAVGVTSIVIGLAVQNAVGPVISGLLLLFEQPFRIGDWLETKSGHGRVVEVNWRAVHLDSGNGIRVVPNAALAGDAFVNLTRTTAPYFRAGAPFAFSADDPPGLVKAALLSVANGVPGKLADVEAKVIPLGAHPVHPGMAHYRLVVPVASPAEADAAVALLNHRVWYAAQRGGLRLDNAEPGGRRADLYLAEHVGPIAAALGLDRERAGAMSAAARLLLYAEGEVIQHTHSVPDAMGFITAGRAEMFVNAEDGRRLSLGDLGAGDYYGGTSLTRQRMTTGVVAATDVTVVSVGREAMGSIVERDHRLTRQIGDAVEMRRRAASEALAAAARGLR